jgi:hypothetical protein
MSVRKLPIAIILLVFSYCSSAAPSLVAADTTEDGSSSLSNREGTEKSPAEIYQAFEESLMADDVEIPLSYIHEDAVISYDYYEDDGATPGHAEVASLTAIKGLILLWMDDPNQQDTEIIKIYSEGDTVYFWLEYHHPDGGSSAQDGYAVIKDGKLYRIHYNPGRLYNLFE